jgi:hypothetical protein
MTTTYSREAWRRSASRNLRQATHKFALGEHVLCAIGVPARKTAFEVTRLMPDGGSGLQYRIKGEQDGVERVVTESSLEAAS